MAFLILGALTVEVLATNPQEDEGDVVGEERRSASGGLLSSVGAVKRRWTFDAQPMTEAEWQTLRALHRTTLTATGTGMPSGGVSVRVLAARAGYLHNGTTTSVLRTPSLVLDEV